MRRLTLIILFSLTVFVSSGQNNTNSPYSIFGIGELENTDGGRNMGMGGSGNALRSEIYLNLANPASLTAIPLQSMGVDAGINFKYSNFQNQQNSVNVLNGNISWAALAFPINRRLAVGFSLNPKSNVGYTIYSTKSLDGTPYSYPVTYKGEGGLSEASFSIAALIAKKFSLGLRSSVLWGNMVKNSVELPPFGSSITRVDNVNYIGAIIKPGFQYNTKLNSNTVLTIGGTAELSSYLNGSSNLTISSGSSIILSEINQQDQLKLPFKGGLGFSIDFKNKYLFTADYNRSDYRSSSVNVDTKGLALNESYHIGFEVAPKYDAQRLGFTKRYRIGALYQTGYLSIYGVQISSYAATCGVSLPIRRDRNSVNLSLEIGQQGSLKNQLILETYGKLNISFALWERWFIPRKYD
ncbi:MAG: hypothetical protein WCJ95_17650 [Mariniphaga sp.]